MASNYKSPDVRGNPLLCVKALSKRYVRGHRWGQKMLLPALCDVDFQIRAGQTLALVGASGSGKSTVARCIALLEQPDSGQIWMDGTDLLQLDSRALLPVRSKIQMIFQDAVTSMNPRFSAAQVIEESLRIRSTSRSECWDIAAAVMKEVGLPVEWLERSIHEFSGGQQQRLAIARALTTRPKVLVLDEAFTGLDLSTQAQIANLLLDLQEAHSLSYLLISHDLGLVAGMAEEIAIMSDGRIVETGMTQQIVSDPRNEEAKKLVAFAKDEEAAFRVAGASL